MSVVKLIYLASVPFLLISRLSFLDYHDHLHEDAFESPQPIASCGANER